MPHRFKRHFRRSVRDIAVVYTLAYGRNGLDQFPMTSDEVRFHAQALNRLRVEWREHKGVKKYFRELRLRTAPDLYDDPRLQGERFRASARTDGLADRDARRFYETLANYQRAALLSGDR